MIEPSDLEPLGGELGDAFCQAFASPSRGGIQGVNKALCRIKFKCDCYGTVYLLLDQSQAWQCPGCSQVWIISILQVTTGAGTRAVRRAWKRA